MNSLIFLDVDGVLNPHEFDITAQSNRIDRDKVLILNQLLDRTGASLVLSSAWRYLVNRDEMTIKGLDWLLRSHGIKAGAVVGITHPDTPVEWDEAKGVPVRFQENERCLQVRRYRARHGHAGAYVVIDDLDLGFTDLGQPFVQTQGHIGITEDDAEKAGTILRWGWVA